MRKVVLGIDGGGSTTRVLVADQSGTVLGYAETGGSNPQHNDREVAQRNVRTAIRQALDGADARPDDVVELTAGFAGLNGDEDASWANAFLDVPGLAFDPVIGNDAVVAHAGALESTPGTVAICGTGSIVFGRTAEGRDVRNYDLDHYARCAARHLGSRVVCRLLTDGRPDSLFVDALFDHWEVESLGELQERLLDSAFFSTAASGNAFDTAAPIITDWAADGDELAGAVCDRSLAEVIEGVRSVGAFFTTDPIPVVGLGSVLESEYMAGQFCSVFDGMAGYEPREPALSPVAGAVYMSLSRVADTDGVAGRLRSHLAAQP